MIRKLLQNDFNKNALTLISGTTIAQAIPIAISPILTRVYSPADFGVLALFIAITSIMGSITNARYEVAIVLPSKDEDAINIAALATLISSTISFFLLLAVLIFGSEISSFLGEKDIKPWLYLTPISVFFIGLFNVFNYLNTRFKDYKTIAKANIIKMLSLAIVQLTLGFLKVGAGGLIVGQMSSFVLGNSKMANRYITDRNLLKQINLKQMKKVGKDYIDFPKFSLGSIFANTLSRNLVNVFISSIYSLGILGYYSLVQRVLGAPSQLIGKSVGQVFYQQCINHRQKFGSAEEVFKSTLFKLLLISVPSFLLLYFISEDLIVFVFGEDWIIAGTYTKILVPLFFVKFITLPLSMTQGAFERQRISLLWQVSLLIITLLIFLFAFSLKLDIIYFLYLFTWILFFHHVVLLVISYKVSKGK